MSRENTCYKIHVTMLSKTQVEAACLLGSRGRF